MCRLAGDLAWRCNPPQRISCECGREKRTEFWPQSQRFFKSISDALHIADVGIGARFWGRLRFGGRSVKIAPLYNSTVLGSSDTRLTMVIGTPKGYFMGKITLLLRWWACFLSPPRTAETILVEARGLRKSGRVVARHRLRALSARPISWLTDWGGRVPDATTSVGLPAAGKYGVQQRTKIGSRPWKAPGTPGAFRLVVNRQAAANAIGNRRREAGLAIRRRNRLARRRNILSALRDLTGFDGR